MSLAACYIYLVTLPLQYVRTPIVPVKSADQAGRPKSSLLWPSSVWQQQSNKNWEGSVSILRLNWSLFVGSLLSFSSLDSSIRPSLSSFFAFLRTCFCSRGLSRV